MHRYLARVNGRHGALLSAEEQVPPAEAAPHARAAPAGPPATLPVGMIAEPEPEVEVEEKVVVVACRARPSPPRGSASAPLP